VILPRGRLAPVQQSTDFPAGNHIEFNFQPETDHPYHIQFRIPPWAEEVTIDHQKVPEGQKTFEMEYRGEQTVLVEFELLPRLILLRLKGEKCAACVWTTGLCSGSTSETAAWIKYV
jgi:hypothetical protein